MNLHVNTSNNSAYRRPQWVSLFCLNLFLVKIIVSNNYLILLLKRKNHTADELLAAVCFLALASASAPFLTDMSNEFVIVST